MATDSEDVLERAEIVLRSRTVDALSLVQALEDCVVALRETRADTVRLAGIDQLIADVSEFHIATGTPIQTRPTVSTAKRRKLRSDLIGEESAETMVALEEPPDLVRIADGLADTIYVCIGAALEFGIPLAAVWVEEEPDA